MATADPEFTAKVEGTLGNDKVDYKLSREKGEDVGTYTITPTGDEKQGNYKVTYTTGNTDNRSSTENDGTERNFIQRSIRCEEAYNHSKRNGRR